MIRKLICLFTVYFLFSCSGKGNEGSVVDIPPGKVILIRPLDNSICIDNNINFDWSDVKGAKSYRVLISKDKLFKSIVKDQKLNDSYVDIVLERGKTFYWSVTAINDNGKKRESSSIFSFYTKGDGKSNTAPFRATLISPKNNISLSGSKVILKWVGKDSNIDDTLRYNLFFGDNSNPLELVRDFKKNSYEVSVESGKTYYWRVDTIDNYNAKSIGQLWRFKIK